MLDKHGIKYLDRWLKAGLLDQSTADHIRSFEALHAPASQTRWAASIAWAFGALLIGAGVISFVASNWEQMPQYLRMLLIVMLTAGFHIAAAYSVEMPSLRMALHGIGTICLGAGIALAGQIFNLSSGWNGWMLLWAAGAAAGYWLIRDWLQLILAALLLPLWISSEWDIRGPRAHSELPIICFWLGLAMLYLLSRWRPLIWLGGIGLVPILITILVINSMNHGTGRTPIESYHAFAAVIAFLAVVGWRTLDGFDIRCFSAIAAVALISFGAAEVGGWSLYLVLGICCVCLAAWGVAEQREELVNLGIASFAITVLGFYVSHALTLLGSSLGLIVFGILMLAGGFALEKTRRTLLGKMS